MAASESGSESKGPPQIYLGDPVAIKTPEKVPLGRQCGRHLLAISLNEADGMGVLAAAWLALLAQIKPGAAQFMVLNNPPPESEWADLPQALAAAFPHHAVEFLNRRSLGPMLQALKEEVRNRLEHSNMQDIFQHGLHEFIQEFIADNSRLGEIIAKQYLI